MGKALLDMPDELHRNLRRRAIDEGISLKELMKKALQEYIEQHPPTYTPTLFDQSTEKEEGK